MSPGTVSKLYLRLAIAAFAIFAGFAAFAAFAVLDALLPWVKLTLQRCAP